MIIKVAAPAKINLGLEIISKQADGYHNVDMIMQSISLFDFVTLKKTESKSTLVKYTNKINLDIKNDIMFKCAELFFKRSGIRNSGLLIETQKNIPLSAGLAGGSSDGGAVLLALNELYGMPFKFDEIMELGAEIGADIPFCIMGGTARAKGIGTNLRAISSKLNYFLVIVKPSISVSTKEAYSLFDKAFNLKRVNLDKLENFILNSDLRNLCFSLFNRFESLIDGDFIKEIKNDLSKFKAIGSLMSGSGSAVYGIFQDEYLANRCYLSLKEKYVNVFICKPINHGVKLVESNS